MKVSANATAWKHLEIGSRVPAECLGEMRVQKKKLKIISSAAAKFTGPPRICVHPADDSTQGSPLSSWPSLVELGPEGAGSHRGPGASLLHCHSTHSSPAQLRPWCPTSLALPTAASAH